ncbi:MAG: hypothetical protein U0T75_14900 [Chitinophagales bacterium]
MLTKVDYTFLANEVLPSVELVQRRKDNLYMALILGNNYNKVSYLNCHTAEGIESIEGILFALTDAFVILKGGLRIPVACIEEVRIY